MEASMASESNDNQSLASRSRLLNYGYITDSTTSYTSRSTGTLRIDLDMFIRRGGSPGRMTHPRSPTPSVCSYSSVNWYGAESEYVEPSLEEEVELPTKGNNEEIRVSGSLNKNGSESPLLKRPRFETTLPMPTYQEEDMTSNNDKQLMEKVQLGNPATQWISVFNAHWPMRQRYHHNVADERLSQHIEEGNSDGLFISCVASFSKLWTLIMDDDIGCSCQVYELSSYFLHKDWIIEQWEKNYYITAIASASNGSSLVVMSKGTQYTQQSYKVSDSFPFEWINKKRREGFYITAMTTAGNRWAVVTSRNAGFLDQVVELGSLYPSEGIQKRLDHGYRITCTAADFNQAAFVLSLPRRKPVGETQETLLTSAFPSTHVVEKWKRNLYITSVCCFIRT